MLDLERPSFEHAPRQRHAQHFVKRQMDDQSTENRYRNGQAPGGAERAHPRRKDQDRGDVKAERVREEDDRGECDQRRAGQGVVDFYFANPTALSAAPRFVSDAAMNLAVSCGSAQITPKPRLAMKSLYSFES